jgi:hypothetical protein
MKQVGSVVQVVADDELDQHRAQLSWIRAMLLERAVDRLHPGGEALQLVLDAPVFGNVLGRPGKPGPPEQLFFVPEMLDATLDQPAGVRNDARLGRAVLDGEQQAVTFLDQFAVQRIDLGAARFE